MTSKSKKSKMLFYSSAILLGFGLPRLFMIIITILEVIFLPFRILFGGDTSFLHGNTEALFEFPSEVLIVFYIITALFLPYIMNKGLGYKNFNKTLYISLFLFAGILQISL